MLMNVKNIYGEPKQQTFYYYNMNMGQSNKRETDSSGNLRKKHDQKVWYGLRKALFTKSCNRCVPCTLKMCIYNEKNPKHLFTNRIKNRQFKRYTTTSGRLKACIKTEEATSKKQKFWPSCVG